MPGLHCTSRRFTNCCFCLSLKTGCKIIGVLTAFICGLELVSACHELIKLLDRERQCMVDNDKWEEMKSKSFLNICPHIKFVQFMLILDFIKFVIGFNGSILLLYGIKTKQPKLFLAWLIFCGLVIFTNFFTILMIRRINVMQNLLVILILCYLFRVVRSYRLQLYDELNNGCPVVAVAFPQESGVQVFVPNQQQSEASSDYIKDDPPPPYPGLPVVASTHSIESLPPPYSVVVNSNSEETLERAEASSSVCRNGNSDHHRHSVSRENSSGECRALPTSTSVVESNEPGTNLENLSPENLSPQSSNDTNRFSDHLITSATPLEERQGEISVCSPAQHVESVSIDKNDNDSKNT